jgi:transposase InsO family protein
VIEIFLSTLTHELYVSPDGAQRSIAEWIDDFYNTQRRHTSLGTMRPINYELSRQMRKRRTQSNYRRELEALTGSLSSVHPL